MTANKSFAEQEVKATLHKLKQYLDGRAELSNQDKVILSNICDNLLKDKPYYSKNEPGRRAEINFQSKAELYFSVFIFKQSGFSNSQIIDYLPPIGEERNISRVVNRVMQRMENQNSKHWYRYSSDALKVYYHKIVELQKLSESEYLKIESYLESVTEFCKMNELGKDGRCSIIRVVPRAVRAKAYGWSKEEERLYELDSLKKTRELVLKMKRTT